MQSPVQDQREVLNPTPRKLILSQLPASGPDQLTTASTASAEDRVGHHCGRAGDAGTITEHGRRNDEMSCGNALAAVQQGVLVMGFR
jgi:hypothetical protein